MVDLLNRTLDSMRSHEMSSVLQNISPYVNNIGPTLVTIISVIWLGYRASSLLILPVDHVIRLLNLDVPPPPQVVLEAVTSDSVSLQWQVPDKQSVSKHLIQLNGTIIGESDKKDTNVIITGLTPDHLYCIRVIAANAHRLHSSSEIIRVRTKPRPQDSQSRTDNSHDHNVPVIQTHAPPNDPSPAQTPTTQSRHRLASVARDQPIRRLSNATKPDRTRSNSTSTSTPPTPQETTNKITSLTQELDRVVRETADLTVQLEAEESRNAQEQQKLEVELEQLRARRREDDEIRASLRAETKSLEEQKRNVDAQKSKLERMLKGTQEELAKIEAEGSARLRDLAEKEQALQDLCDQTAVVERNVLEANTQGRKRLEEVQRQISGLEESNRLLAQKIAAKKAQMENIDTDEEKSRKKLIDEREDEEDAKVEREWIASEAALKARLDQVKTQVDEANREYREALALLVQAREMSTHSGGGLSVAKHRSKKPRSRRSRQKALSMMGPNVSSPSLSAGELTLSSRPASLALPTGADVGTFYTPDYHELPYDFSSSSPWASTHSLGMHDAPLAVETDLERDRLTGGALLSPSVSEHLLPSNLFGPDEDSIRTSPYIDQLLQSSPPSVLPHVPTAYPPIVRTADSPVSEMSTRSSFSSPNQSHPALPVRSDFMFQEPPQYSPSITLTHYSDIPMEAEEPVEVTSPAELNGIPLSAENTDEETQQETASTAKYWKIPSISFKRKTVPPERRLPLLGTLKGEKARSLPRTIAGVTPIGFNRPRSGSGSSAGWLQNMTRARAPSETGRQFDMNFDPLESRTLLEGAGVVHHHSALSNSVVFEPSPRASFDSRSSMHRRSTETDIARAFGSPYYSPPGMYPDINHPYGWMPQSRSTPLIQPPLSLPTSPSANPGGSPILVDRWSPPDTSRSSLDPKAPEFRMNLAAPGPEVVEDVSPKRGTGLFTLTRRSTVRSQGDSFLNNFTGLFRRDTKVEEEDNDLIRPKSRDTLNSGDPSIGGSTEDLTAETSPGQKKKEKKKKDKSKGKGLFRWESKTDISEEPDLVSLDSTKEEQEEDSPRKKEKKHKKGKKGVKFEKDDGEAADSTPSKSEGGPYYFHGREVTLNDKFLSPE